LAEKGFHYLHTKRWKSFAAAKKKMKNLILKLRGCINKDLVFVALNQMWRLISGPLTLVFIPLFLSAELQGFWFTFSRNSVAMVQKIRFQAAG
jgi:hypothetical protein